MSSQPLVTVNRKMLFALFALAWLGVFSTAGVASGLAQRAGAAAWLANAVAFGTAAILMYPYFALRLEMDGKPPMPPFWKYTLHCLGASVVANLCVTSLITRAFP